MTIKFIKHKARKDYDVRIFKIKKRDDILKICFSKKDIHVSRNKTLHLDIWGKKLEDLKELLGI
ncbi:MAG: hypothetical protein KAW92_11830 [Candidatus Cloacimonetes bacterium]|nr:hypothetical protein [Candidatus Cloacimonadota bacterium]